MTDGTGAVFSMYIASIQDSERDFYHASYESVSLFDIGSDLRVLWIGHRLWLAAFQLAGDRSR